MLVHPNIDPVAIHLGPLKVHWYGLMYLLGFWGSWWLATVRGRKPWLNWPKERVSDVLFYVVLGVILGGRIGYLLFYSYDPQGHWLPGQDPMTVFRIWEGGMSFHGGMLGVVVAIMLFARKYHVSLGDVADFIAVVVPFGLFTGRIGNFINGELWGATTSLPWGMVFQAAGPLPRHPSQLYEAALEGLALLGILWWYGSKPRPKYAITGLFLLGYATFRFAIEFVRLPDVQLGYLYGTTWFTMGMQLCIPMFIAGAAFMIYAYRQNASNGTGNAPVP